MRFAVIIAGLLLAGLGAAAAMGKLHYTENKELLRVGNFSAKVQQEEPVPRWLDFAAIIGGGIVALGGSLWRK